MSLPLVSIVVCTHNRADMLGAALESLARLHTGEQFEYEIVVIDNASNDSTPDVIRQFATTTTRRVVSVCEGRKGIAFARNRGVKESSGEWIAFFDDDQLADERWLWELWSACEEQKLLGVGGTVELKLPADCQRSLHPFVRMLLGEARYGSTMFPYSHRRTFGAGNLMLHRVLLETVGLFDEAFNTRGEDTDLFCRIEQRNFQTWYIPTAIVQHVTPSERLERAYLERLARQMGTSLARREHATFAPVLFALRLLARGIRRVLWQAPRMQLARWIGSPENASGWTCQHVLSRAYETQGWQLLRADFSTWWNRLTTSLQQRRAWPVRTPAAGR